MNIKGIFTRNLGELDRYLPNRPYKSWLEAQATSNWNNNRNSLNQFGVHWMGPFDRAHGRQKIIFYVENYLKPNILIGGNQHSAFEAFIAAV